MLIKSQRSPTRGGGETLISPQVSLVGADEVVFSKKISNESRIRFAKDEATGKLYFVVDVVLPADNEIWYTTSDKQVITKWQSPSFGEMVSTIYENHIGKIIFKDPISEVYGYSNSTGSFSYFSENDCGKKIIDISLPNSVTIIGSSAFSRCYSLTSITIPNSVTSIGAGAFSSCYSLASIVIPECVTSIGYQAFSSCCFTKDNFINNSSLDAESNSYWGARVGDVEIDNMIIKNNTIIACRKHSVSVSIPNDIITIGNGSFSGCTSLNSVNIGNNVTNIEKQSFAGCSSLTSLTFPENILNVDVLMFGIFSATHYVTNVVWNAVKCNDFIPYHVGGPSKYSPFHCNSPSVTSFVFGNRVKYIPSKLCYGCKSLTSITFEGTMEEWNFIEKGTDWNINVPATYVQCSDGQVAL